MQFKVKLAAVGSAMVLMSGIATVTATSASAVNDQGLCVTATNGSQTCADGTTIPKQPSGVQLTMAAYDESFFNTPGSYGRISVYASNPGSCLEITDSAAGTVKTEPCNSSLAEDWYAVSVSGGKAAYYQNAAYQGLCLNDKYYDALLNAAPCPASGKNANQDFYPDQQN